ncbi:MAG: PKD domain-containing protein [Ferruginibacter sp.]|nr:PKD domain-containing protein [Ferruginibacter sp.]
MKKIFFISLFLFRIGYTQTTSISGVINSYTPVISLDICQNKILVEDGSSFKIGDTVLIIQMKGAVIDTSSTAAFGSVLNYKNAGNYEFNYVKGLAGNIIQLLNTLTRNYDIGFGKVQLVRVPYFINAKVAAPLTSLPWDGSKGGILALNIRDSLVLENNIDVTGKGFSGGKVENTRYNSSNCFVNGYFFPTTSNQIASPRGESITTVGSDKALGKGALASGGGGGLDHNSGGGGGANISDGGFGGYQLLDCGSSPFDNRGIGGKGLITDGTINKIFLGGGGGAGHCNNGFYNNAENSNFSGANGGGIISIQAKFLKGNGYAIISNGDSAYNPVFTDALGHDGKGGGGAGGTILITTGSYIGNVSISSKGGTGADLWTDAFFSKVGPGGGGAGGLVWMSQPLPVANVNVSMAGGLNGIVQYANDPWGAMPGKPGVILYNLKMPVDTSLFPLNIDSLSIKDSAISCQQFDFKGLAITRNFPIAKWSWNFGDNSVANTQNTSHSYTPAGLYDVKLIVTDANGCVDSTGKTINSTGAGSTDFNYKQDICNPFAVQFFPLGNSSATNYWSFGDGSITTGNDSPTHVYTSPGSYLVKYFAGNSACSDTISKTILINVAVANIITTSDTTICFNSTKQLRSVGALQYCWSPSTYLSDPKASSPTTSTPEDITYFLTAEIPGVNLITNGNFTSGNTAFTSQYSFAANNTTEGEYFVGANPQTWNASLSACTDHTTGNGNMILVNGAPGADVNVWTQTVAVTPNTNYAFSTWIQALFPPNPAELSFSINGGNLGTLITAALPTCTWKQFYTTWNSGNNTTATIAIVNKNTLVQGNDFALDDIEFSAVLIKRDSVKITVEKPTVKASADTSTCSGQPVQISASGAGTYSWSPAAGLNNSSSPNPIATLTASTQYVVSGTSINGCTAKDTVNVSLKPSPVVTKSKDTTICNNSQVQLIASGGSSYSWTPIASLDNATIANPVATPTANTIYKLVITGTNSCTTTDSVKISLRPKPVFSISPSMAACANSSVSLNATGGTSYFWSPTASLSDSTVSTPVSVTNTTTTYTVKIKDSFCNDSTSLSTTVTISPAPTITAGKSNDIDCSTASAELTATGADNYVWSPSTGLNNSTISNPTVTINASQQYLVTGTDILTNCTGIDTITVFASYVTPTALYIPNAFTPNGDGKNDCFRIGNFNLGGSVDFSIYDREGNRVFHALNSNACWDGTFKGQPMKQANYVYYIKTYSDCGNYTRKGNVLLLR